MNLYEALVDHRPFAVKAVVHAVQHVYIQRLVISDAHGFAKSHDAVAATRIGVQAGIPFGQVHDRDFFRRHHRLFHKPRIDAAGESVGIEPGRFHNPPLMDCVFVAANLREAGEFGVGSDPAFRPHKLALIVDRAVISNVFEIHIRLPELPATRQPLRPPRLPSQPEWGRKIQ